MKEITIATRASKLALAQANQTKRNISLLSQTHHVSLIEISTKGDRDKSDFLYKVGSTGFFTSEVERALLDGRADIGDFGEDPQLLSGISQTRQSAY